MSVGHIISDNRSMTGTACGGTGLTGEYFETQWSGGDRLYPEDMTPHNYQKNVTQSYNGPVRFNAHAIGNVFECYGGCSLPVLNWDDNDTLKLSIKLGNKIRDHDFNGAIFLAEASESMALIGETAHRLAKFFGSVKSGNLYKASSFLVGGDKQTRREKYYNAMKNHFKKRSAFDDRKALANAILEVQYGWRPMLSDAAGLGTSMAAVLSRPPRTRYTVTRKIQSTRVTESGPDNERRKWVSRKTISKRLLVTVSAPPTWREELRLGDVGRAITNKTPWLFVANWFLPFEDYMEARSVFTDLHITDIILTSKTQSGGVFTGPYDSEASLKNFEFKREVLTNSPNGSIFANKFLNPPSFKPIEKSLGWEHMLNGIALLNTTVKRYRN